MVAYSFKACFADQVAALTKLQTVRADRRRHARPGEAVQLFYGMRTRQCRKLVSVDPICTAICPVSISVTALLDELIASISIDGKLLTRSEIEAFAVADGFDPEHFGAVRSASTISATARYWMGRFWLENYGEGRFDGMLIRWRPA